MQSKQGVAYVNPVYFADVCKNFVLLFAGIESANRKGTA